MNSRFSLLAAALAGTSLLSSHASAQTLSAITEWNFNNVATGVNTSPATSTGTGTASTLGMNFTSSSTNPPTAPTVDTSDINNSTPLSSDPGTGGVNTQWRIRGGDGTASPGAATNAWSSAAPIGSQGAQFAVSTTGFQNIQVSFDWSPTGQGEGKLQLQYTLNGSTYFNVPASLLTVPTGATLATNATSANTVMGAYIQSSAAVYYNGITANLSSIIGASNDPTFAVRMVNASTGADDVNSTGGALNNTSGNWRFDEVTISGIAIPAAGGIPEPGTCALIALGAAGAALLVYRRRATV